MAQSQRSLDPPMTNVLIVLLVLSAGLSSFVRARSEGLWSWRRFAKTLAGTAVLLTAVIPLGLALMRLGPKHALLGTIVMTSVILAGVAALTAWSRKKV